MNKWKDEFVVRSRRDDAIAEGKHRQNYSRVGKSRP